MIACRDDDFVLRQREGLERVLFVEFEVVELVHGLHGVFEGVKLKDDGAVALSLGLIGVPVYSVFKPFVNAKFHEEFSDQQLVEDFELGGRHLGNSQD